MANSNNLSANDSASRLKIQAYEKADYSGSAVKEFEVMFNPDSYSKKFEAEYEAAQAQGNSSSPQVFKRIKPREITLEFTIDGTNAVKPINLSSEEMAEIKKSDSEMSDVEAKVEEFRKTCIDLVGSKHRPYYLYLVWGDLWMYCILKSADVKYSLFKSDGKALRAKISATFAENETDETRAKRERKSSPDLTHIRTVMKGDTLPLMCYRIYGDSAWYYEVARINKIKEFRRIEPGTQLLFPPIDKSVQSTSYRKSAKTESSS